jgi:dTDP-3,4-didehydro-2,6-dideoxy-alpha-D-glucose 3-reductase
VNVLLVGHSRIGQKRVLPALRALGDIRHLAVASRRCQPAARPGNVTVFQDYETAISQSGADLAYISLENSNHAAWAERALRQGMHVVVDKPAFLTLEDARRLSDLADSQHRCLAEATVFAFHPQIAAFAQAFDAAGSAPARVVAMFSFPPLDASDFRYRKDRGGGALFDVGPYAVATSRLLFRRPPRSVSCEILARRPDGVDTAFSVLMSYDAGGAFVGHFGFDTEYQNRLIAFGPGVAADLNRAFTLPPDAANKFRLRRNNVESEVSVAPTDSFAAFLRVVLDAIEHDAWDGLTRALLDDAALLARLRTSSGEQ